MKKIYAYFFVFSFVILSSSLCAMEEEILLTNPANVPWYNCTIVHKGQKCVVNLLEYDGSKGNLDMFVEKAAQKAAIKANLSQFKKKLARLDTDHDYEVNLSKFFLRLKKCRESKSQKETIVKQEIQQFLASYKSRIGAENMYYIGAHYSFFARNFGLLELITVNPPERILNSIYQKFTVNKHESYFNYYAEYDLGMRDPAQSVITTALGVAVCAEDPKLVALLLLVGHDPNVNIEAPKNLESYKNEIKTPLQLAITLHNKEIITLLFIAGANKNGVSRYEHALRYEGYHDIAGLLHNFYQGIDANLLYEM